MFRFNVLLVSLLAAGAIQALTSGVAFASPKRVAVLPIENPAQLSVEEVGFLTDLIRGEAMRGLPTDDFIVMTQENLTAMLPPGSTLADCIGECAIETGKNLKAHYIVTGRVIRFGASMRLSIRAHVTATKAMLAQREAKGQKVEDFEVAIKREGPQVISQILRHASGATAPVLGAAPVETLKPDVTPEKVLDEIKEATKPEKIEEAPRQIEPPLVVAPPAPKEDVATSGLTGFARVQTRARTQGGFTVDDLGTEQGSDKWLAARLRLGASYKASKALSFTIEGALQADRIGDDGAPFGLAVGEDTLRVRRDSGGPELRYLPRQLYFTALTPVGLFKCGHQAAHWGMGILVNDGAHERPFGDAWSASLVERCLVGVKVGESVTVFVGGDYVYRDENADHNEGDRAFGWSIGARYAKGDAGNGEDSVQVSLLAAQRFQTDRLDPRYPAGQETEVTVNTTDLHLRWRRPLSGGAELNLEGEAAIIFGHTTRPYLEETFEDGADVLAMGGLGRLSYRWGGLEALMEIGYASGDNDPQDDVSRQFTFHSGYSVGLVLFEQVLPLVSARAADRLMDPALVAVPPSGTRFTVAQGGVRNALYLNPVIRWRPVDAFEMVGGYLLAQSAADVVDVYQSATRGGFNTTVGGQQPGSRALGQEANLKVLAHVSLNRLQARIGLEGGYFLPGDAFKGVIEDPVSTGRVTLDLDW